MNDELIGQAIGSFIGFVMMIAIVFGVVSCQNYTQAKWNNGICSECGGRYKFVMPIGHQYITEYWYECEDCGHGIELYDHMEEVQDELDRTR